MISNGYRVLRVVEKTVEQMRYSSYYVPGSVVNILDFLTHYSVSSKYTYFDFAFNSAVQHGDPKAVLFFWIICYTHIL